MKIFFATDVHGSEICWKKFLNAAAFYKADMVVLGGDVTGKAMVPIIALPGYWETKIRGELIRVETREDLLAVEQRIRDRGFYPMVITPDEYNVLAGSEEAKDQRFESEMLRSLDRWLNMADDKLGNRGDIPCILNGGNDDIFDIDPVIEASPAVTFAEGKVLDLGGFYMTSMGWTNPTPWDTHREAPEADLTRKIDAAVASVPDLSRTIFNFHAPPFGTGLDEAPALDATLRPTHGGAVMKPVGSTAVRDAISKYQPLVSLHGHIHESKGVAKLGRSLAVNPGSSYSDGVLQAALIDLDGKKGRVKYVLVNG
jgi:uncharacterized protein